MPAYSFKEQFCESVQTGSKTHTVRALRTGKSRHAMPGDTVYLYYGMRTKFCRKLGEGICTKVDKITISHNGIFLSGRALSQHEMNVFAWKDGFRPEGSTAEEPGSAWLMMWKFWGTKLDTADGWKGVVIYWKLKPNALYDDAKFGTTAQQLADDAGNGFNIVSAVRIIKKN